MSTLINPKQIEGWDDMVSKFNGVKDTLEGTEDKVETVQEGLDKINESLENIIGTLGINKN